MWITACFEYKRDIFHIEDRAWRIIQRIRERNIDYSPEDLKKEILELMKSFSEYEDKGLDKDTSLPKKKVKINLSKLDFPIYLVIIEDAAEHLRMLKTFWTDRELVKNGKEDWEKLKKRHLAN